MTSGRLSAAFVLLALVQGCGAPEQRSAGDEYQATRYSQDQDAARGNPGYTPKQDSFSFFRLFEVLGTLLDSHPSGNFGHRS